MSNKPGMNKKIVGGGVVLLVLGTLLSFNGFGVFSGDGEGPGDGSGELQVTTSSTDPPTEATPVTTATRSSDGVLDIVIDDRKYLVREENGNRHPLELGTITTVAKQMPGNSEGFKVRVARKKSAVYSSERALSEALEESGIKPEQIFWISEPVE